MNYLYTLSIILITSFVLFALYLFLKNKARFIKLHAKITKRWKKPFTKIEIPSSKDNENQLAYYYNPQSEQKTPLIVSLHSWAGDYNQIDPTISEHVIKAGWNYIHPDFRGINNTPQACGSKLSMSDINDAIEYAIDKGNVDLDNIFIVGGSGGAYSALCFYSETKYPINSYIVWSPITDLIAWHDQSIIRKSRYSRDIMIGTRSKDVLDINEAKRRSPLHRDMPKTNSEIHIFTGYHDGYDSHGPVPVTHSLDYFNEYATRHNAEPSDLIPSDDIIQLVAREYQETSNYIEDRKVIYTKNFKNIHATVFDGGHDHLANHSIKLIIENIQ